MMLFEAEIAAKLTSLMAAEMRRNPHLTRSDCTARVLAGVTDSRHPNLVSRLTRDGGGNSRRPFQVSSYSSS